MLNVLNLVAFWSVPKHSCRLIFVQHPSVLLALFAHMHPVPWLETARLASSPLLNYKEYLQDNTADIVLLFYTINDITFDNNNLKIMKNNLIYNLFLIMI